MAADVGVQGRISDGGVFKNSAMYFALENNKLNLPDPCRLSLTVNDESDPNRSSVPCVFAADDVFQLTSYCMKPYGRKNMTDAQRTFDYRFSRKRRVPENAFGILVNKFRVFSVRNNLNENDVSIVPLPSLSLHNLLRERSRDTYTPPGFTDEIQMDGNICNGTSRDEASLQFVCPPFAPPLFWQDPLFHRQQFPLIIGKIDRQIFVHNFY